MANHAARSQLLPIMVRKPKAVWPGLVQLGMSQKQIAGDGELIPFSYDLTVSANNFVGNCLFASLSDQLYGDPTKHPEIRAKIIEHMRNFRPLFESYVHKDDVTSRRTTRAAANTIAQETDSFEEYLLLMSRAGSYGGEPELVAFCQVYDQDVTVHLPRIEDFDRDSIFYTNEHREKKEGHQDPPMLHICYGGDEVTRAHYDSARNRDGSHPRSTQSPKLEAEDSRRNSTVPNEPSPLSGTPSARAIRNADLPSELFQDMFWKGKKDLDATLEALNHRARSSSVSSSHRSNSSKRSLEDDGDYPRRKRADRRKSTRKRTDMSTVSYEADDGLIQIHSPADNTPASTQDTEVSSDAAEKYNSDSEDADYRPKVYDDEDEGSDYEIRSSHSRRKIIKPSSRATIIHKATTSHQASHPIKIAERPRNTLRT